MGKHHTIETRVFKRPIEKGLAPYQCAPILPVACSRSFTLKIVGNIWYGAVAQLIERYIRIVEARGLIPLTSTIPLVLGNYAEMDSITFKSVSGLLFAMEDSCHKVCRLIENSWLQPINTLIDGT